MATRTGVIGAGGKAQGEEAATQGDHRQWLGIGRTREVQDREGHCGDPRRHGSPPGTEESGSQQADREQPECSRDSWQPERCPRTADPDPQPIGRGRADDELRLDRRVVHPTDRVEGRTRQVIPGNSRTREPRGCRRRPARPASRSWRARSPPGDCSPSRAAGGPARRAWFLPRRRRPRRSRPAPRWRRCSGMPRLAPAGNNRGNPEQRRQGARSRPRTAGWRGRRARPSTTRRLPGRRTAHSARPATGPR